MTLHLLRIWEHKWVSSRLFNNLLNIYCCGHRVELKLLCLGNSGQLHRQQCKTTRWGVKNYIQGVEWKWGQQLQTKNPGIFLWISLWYANQIGPHAELFTFLPFLWHQIGEFSYHTAHMHFTVSLTHIFHHLKVEISYDYHMEGEFHKQRKFDGFIQAVAWQEKLFHMHLSRWLYSNIIV